MQNTAQNGGGRAVGSTALLLLCALGVLGGEALAQERPPWWDTRWPYRKLLTVDPEQDWGWAPAARAWIHLRPEADHGGRDLRVIGPDGQPVPFGVRFASSEGRYLIAFEARRKDGFYAVYYGQPVAEPVEANPPRRGLVYETRPIPEGAVVNAWPAAEATMEAAGPSHGAAHWNRVFDAYNPFGPQKDYIGIYRGYVRCPAGGAYGFATLSDHSSFLLIDGELVTQWVGPHNIHQGQRGERGGTVELSQGTHEFLYVHFAFGAPGRAAAAWKPPGRDRFEIMPHSAFPGLPEAEVYECEALERPSCADFTAEPESYCEAGEAKMTAFRCASKSSVAGDALIDRYLWEFGDGQTADGSAPQHVFLTPGLYTVTLTITSTAGERAACSKRVRVGPIYEDLDFPLKKLDRFWGLTKGYRLDRLPTPSLLAAWEFFRHLEREERALDAAVELDRRRSELTPVQLYDVAMALGQRYQAVERELDRAESYFRLALEAVPESQVRRRFDARFALCDHYFYYREDYEQARREYVKLRAEFPQGDPAKRRVALIRIGDTYRYEGDVEEALRIYRQAEGDPAYAPDKPRELLVGAMIHAVQSYLRRGEGEEGLERLEELLWLFPTLRLEGQPALLRAEAALMQADFKEARKQAELYIEHGTDPNFLPALHVAAAEACMELGLTDEAGAHYRAVLEDFPESPQVADAEEGLRRLEN
jgi:tetratricopeptide (TPR) repeat protein